MSDPAVMFVERPNPPDTDSAEDLRWRKEASISFEGGYIKAKYGDLVQTFNLGSALDECSAISVARAGYTATRTNVIGGASKSIVVPAGTYNRFPSTRSSLAAGGLPYTFVTDVGTYVARVGGEVETTIQWICDHKVSIFGTLSVFTNRGNQYGPFSASV